MDRLNSRQLGLIFTGSFLGAGFVSGQEIMQFFGVFGNKGIIGMILAIILFGLFGYMFMFIAKTEKITSINQIILGDGKSILHYFLSGISLLFLFGVTVIMLAGAGSLLNELFGIPYFAGSALLTIILACLSLKGIKGILIISQIVVPVLLVLVVIVSLWAMMTFQPMASAGSISTAGNPLLGNWFLAMLSFFSYNILASLAVLAPAAQRIPDMKTTKRGIILGAVQLLLMFACILISLQRFFGYVADADFPMQALAGQIHPILGGAYALLLLSAMFNGALACMFGATVQMFGEVHQKKMTILGLWGIAFVCSLAGFKELISVIFPVCGYAYFIAMPITVCRFLKVRHGTREQTMHFNEKTIDYITFGTGSKTLVMIQGLNTRGIHGAALPLAWMYRIFAKEYTVYLFDRKKEIAEEITSRELAADLAEAMDALQLTDADILGVSQGGMIAQYLAIDRPDLVNKMVLAVTYARDNQTLLGTVNRWIQLTEQGNMKELVCDMAEKMYSESYVRRYRPFLPMMTWLQKPKDCSRFVLLAKSCFGCNAYDELEKIQCPVLVIGGQQDQVVGADASLEIAKKLGCEIHMYEGLGHAAYEEAKDFNQRVYEFLGKE